MIVLLDCVRISEVIERLTHYSEGGYELIGIETYHDHGHGLTYCKVVVSRKHMETGEEFEGGVQDIKSRERLDREHYERLKARFEP